jgi:hypothetical protein
VSLITYVSEIINNVSAGKNRSREGIRKNPKRPSLPGFKPKMLMEMKEIVLVM